LGKLVDDVIVLGQNLAGDIEGDRIGSMLLDCPAESVRNMIERGIPTRLLAVDHRSEQSPLETDGLGERRALCAQPPEIGGMKWIAPNGNRARGIPISDDAAADATIRAGCLHWHGRSPSLGGHGRRRLEAKPDDVVLHLGRMRARTSLVGSDRRTALELNDEIVQRTGDALVMD